LKERFKDDYSWELSNDLIITIDKLLEGQK